MEKPYRKIKIIPDNKSSGEPKGTKQKSIIGDIDTRKNSPVKEENLEPANIKRIDFEHLGFENVLMEVQTINELEKDVTSLNMIRVGGNPNL
jgi:hypothetical protein